MSINVVGLYFEGTPFADHLTGGGGDDLFGMTADDFVTDTVNGGAGTDTVDYSRSQVGVDITLTDPFWRSQSGGSVGAEFPINLYNPATHSYVHAAVHDQTVATLTSIEDAQGSNFNDVINGNSGGNMLRGLGGNDVISGGGGNDTIVGGAGHDTMTGGAGHDSFAFNHASDGPLETLITNLDKITDFVRGEDKIDLSGLVAETTNHHALSFVSGGPFTGVPGQVAAVFEGQGFLVAVDLNGDRHQDFEVLVGSSTLQELHHPLQATDFILH